MFDVRLLIGTLLRLILYPDILPNLSRIDIKAGIESDGFDIKTNKYPY